VVEYKFTEYFLSGVLRKRPYLKKEWCIFTIQNYIRDKSLDYNRHKLWAAIPELNGKFLRVITLDDMRIIHNAFPDRGFKP